MGFFNFEFILLAMASNSLEQLGQAWGLQGV